MPRQRLAPGEHGRITETSKGGTFFASTYVRDSDGKRRRVERSSNKSPEDARRILQRHLGARRAPLSGRPVTDKTTLTELFELWINGKVARGELKPQTVRQYRQVWSTHAADQIGSLRIRELPTSRAEEHLQTVFEVAQSQAGYLRIILRSMYGTAVRFDVLDVNPITETKIAKREHKPVRAVQIDEFARIRAAVATYASSRDGKGGPRPGRLLLAFIELLAATGARPNEILAVRWEDVDLLGDPPTVTINGTLIDHQRVPGKPLHRQAERKHGTPSHTVVLPRFGVEALTAMVGESGMTGPVFANRDGGWVSLANLRRSLRAALPEDLSWCTPHSFRRTVATVVRDAHGPALAQQQLSHAKLATTEAHYLQRQTRGPDVRDALDRFAGKESGD